MVTAGARRGPLVVLGDSMLDIDIEGEASRLSPEAPVPVVDVTRQRRRPGGAGLAALLAARSGREVILVTAIGVDDLGDALRNLLADHVEVRRCRWTATLSANAGSRRARFRCCAWIPDRDTRVAGPCRPEPYARSSRRARSWSPTTAAAWPACLRYGRRSFKRSIQCR